MAIIAHEMGHVTLTHMPWLIFGNALHLTFFLVIFMYISANGTDGFYASFGWNTYLDKSPYIAALLADEIANAFEIFTKMIKLRIVRNCEYEADQYVHEKSQYGKDLNAALTCLFIRDKTELAADPMFSLIKHSHPTLQQRITRSIKIMQNQDPDIQREVWGSIPDDADKAKTNLDEIVTEDFVRNIEVESKYDGPTPLKNIEKGK
jgi:Zn-dependent protease with chaperone function